MCAAACPAIGCAVAGAVAAPCSSAIAMPRTAPRFAIGPGIAPHHITAEIIVSIAPHTAAMAFSFAAAAAAMRVFTVALVPAFGMAIMTAMSFAITHTSAILLGPAYRIISATVTMSAPVMMPPAGFVVATAAIPIIPLLAPITPVAAMHIMPAAIGIEKIEAIAGVIVIVIPSAAIADIGKAIAIVATIIAIEFIVGIAAAICIVTASIAKAIIIIGAARSDQAQPGYCRQPDHCPAAYFCKYFRHLSPLVFGAALIFRLSIRWHALSYHDR